MDTWMVLDTPLRVDHVSTQIPSRGKFRVGSTRYGRLKKRIQTQSHSISRGKDFQLLRSLLVLLPGLSPESVIYPSVTHYLRQEKFGTSKPNIIF
jgi:hypothetical protein